MGTAFTHDVLNGNSVIPLKEYLVLFNRISENCCAVITVDETWIQHTTLETKQQLKEWGSPGESALKNARIGFSANKDTYLGYKQYNSRRLDLKEEINVIPTYWAGLTTIGRKIEGV